MKRKTIKQPSGAWSVLDNSGKPIPWDELPTEIYGALCKLKDYEDTELSPDDAASLKDMVCDLSDELAELKRSQGESNSEIFAQLSKVVRKYERRITNERHN